MKRWIAFLCIISLCASVMGCGSGKEENLQESSSSEETAGQTQESAQEDSSGSTGESVEESLPEEDLSQEQEVTWSPEMTAIKQAVVDEFGENYWPATAIPAEMLEGTYGVSPDMYEDYFGEIPLMMTNVDTLIVIKPADGKVQDVENALNAYRDMMVSDTMQYPMNLGKIQASRVERVGDCVCFVQLGADVMEALEQGDEAVIKQCLEQNELAIEVIRKAVAE